VISPSGPRTRFEKLAEVYAQLCAEFRHLGYATLVDIADVWANSLSQMHSMLRESNPPVKRSALVAGLEQGLRETPLMLSALPEAQRRLALKTFRRVVASNAPGFFEKNRGALDKIVARGKIKNEREWYLIRHRVDEIEGDASRASELTMLYRLMDAYENAA
jgi:hypothetical protein